MPQTSAVASPFDLRRVTAIGLLGLTPESRAAIGGDRVAVRDLPFRVGRESRRTLLRLAASIERRLGHAPDLNDLYIVDEATERHVSREHFLIDASEEGFFLLDRGSVCGTLVNGVAVGGRRQGGRIALANDDVIIAGSGESPFVFQFQYEIRT